MELDRYADWFVVCVAADIDLAHGGGQGMGEGQGGVGRGGHVGRGTVGRERSGSTTPRNVAISSTAVV